MMTEDEMRHFVDTVAATAYANQAILACILAGVIPTTENVIPIVGKMLNPNNEHFERMVMMIEAQRKVTMDAARSLSLDIRKPER